MVAFGPSYSTVVSPGRLGRLQGESPAEAADRAARENQAQTLNTQRIEDNARSYTFDQYDIDETK